MSGSNVSILTLHVLFLFLVISTHCVPNYHVFTSLTCQYLNFTSSHPGSNLPLYSNSVLRLLLKELCEPRRALAFTLRLAASFLPSQLS